MALVEWVACSAAEENRRYNPTSLATSMVGHKQAVVGKNLEVLRFSQFGLDYIDFERFDFRALKFDIEANLTSSCSFIAEEGIRSLRNFIEFAWAFQ